MLLGYISALLIGISLGLVGSGGSILAVPILVELMHIDPEIATAYSLFIVGITATTGSFRHVIEKKIDYRLSLIFGLPSIFSVYFTRIYLLQQLPEKINFWDGFQLSKPSFLFVCFMLIMLTASIAMILPQSREKIKRIELSPINYLVLISLGLIVGFIAGFVGAGGGFLIVPALVLVGRVPTDRAIITSLFIVCLNSLVGFIGVVQTIQTIDWKLLILFSGIAILGMLFGLKLGKKIPGKRMKPYFGWLILILAIYLSIIELHK